MEVNHKCVFAEKNVRSLQSKSGLSIFHVAMAPCHEMESKRVQSTPPLVHSRIVHKPPLVHHSWVTNFFYVVKAPNSELSQ